jgi:hypothetical protein
MEILDRIRALPRAPLATDAAFERADETYRAAREAARYAADDLRAAEADDRERGLLQSSAATDRAQSTLDAARVRLKAASTALEAERARFGKVFLRDHDATAREVADLTLSLSNALEALRSHAWTVANFASMNRLPIHRAVDHAASLDGVVRKLKFQG